MQEKLSVNCQDSAYLGGCSGCRVEVRLNGASGELVAFYFLIWSSIYGCVCFVKIHLVVLPYAFKKYRGSCVLVLPFVPQLCSF